MDHLFGLVSVHAYFGVLSDMRKCLEIIISNLVSDAAILVHLFYSLIVAVFFFAARILRAVRIAARLDFRFSKETALAVRKLSASVLRLDRVSRNFFCFMVIFNCSK